MKETIILSGHALFLIHPYESHYYKQFYRINLQSVCNSGPVRIWSKIKNINYHQFVADPLNEATAALCMKANRLFLILKTLA